MNPYNGFTGAQRDKAQRWLNQQWALGALKRPIECVACGQDQGVIDAHAEDYSEPFRAGVTDAFHLCFVCHMMVHCRYRNEPVWRNYRDCVEFGFRARAFFNRNWPGFQKEYLVETFAETSFTRARRPMRKALLEIELSQNEVTERLRALGLSVARAQ